MLRNRNNTALDLLVRIFDMSKYRLHIVLRLQKPFVLIPAL